MKIYKSRLNKGILQRNNFFSVRVLNSWNSLPDDTISAKTINSFQNRLDKLVLAKHRTYIAPILTLSPPPPPPTARPLPTPFFFFFFRCKVRSTWMDAENWLSKRDMFSIKPPILLKYKNLYKRNSMYPNISKCNAKSCTCCNHLIYRSTIISSVNHRKFSVVNNSDLD